MHAAAWPSRDRAITHFRELPSKLNGPAGVAIELAEAACLVLLRKSNDRHITAAAVCHVLRQLRAERLHGQFAVRDLNGLGRFIGRETATHRDLGGEEFECQAPKSSQRRKWAGNILENRAAQESLNMSGEPAYTREVQPGFG